MKTRARVRSAAQAARSSRTQCPSCGCPVSVPLGQRIGAVIGYALVGGTVLALLTFLGLVLVALGRAVL